MMKVKCMMTGILCALISVCASAQVNISGRIVDAASNRPVKDASIRVDKSLSKSVTNGNGEFSISNLSEGSHTLSITHVSYEPKSVTVDGSSKDVLISLNETNFNVGQVVVTGTGTHRRLKDSPVPVQVITAQDIANASVTTLDEALQKLTSVFTSKTNGMGTFLNMNGLGDDYYIFLLNGRRLAGDDTYSRINVNNVKRIEILNGASSTLYGTNAIGGVINIITDDAKNSIQASNDIKLASNGRLNESVNVDIAKGKIGSYTSYRRQQQDSYQLSPYEEDKNGDLVETNKIASTGFHTDVISERLTYDANDRLSFFGDVSYYRYKTDRPYDLYSYDIYHQTFTYGAGMKYLINKKAYITADYNVDNYASKYSYYKDVKSSGIVAGDEVTRKRTRYHNGTLKGIFNINSWNKLTVGVDYILDVLKSESDNIEKESAYTLAAFAQDEIKILPGLQALLGVRYLYHETFHSYATPNVSLMYKLGGFNFRGTYAAGFKAPSLSEIYATDVAKTNDRLTIGNTDLKPEKNNFYSFNAEYNHSRFNITGNIFLNKVRDMIDYLMIATGDEAIANYGHAQVRQRTNLNRARVLGINFTGNAYLGAGFSLNASYTHLKAKNEETDEPIDNSIKNSAVVTLNWKHTWNPYTLNVNVNGRMYSRRYSASYGYAPHYQMWDITTRHTFNLKKFVVEPAIGIENIFDWTDDRPWNSNYASLNSGIAPFVSLAIKFKD